MCRTDAPAHILSPAEAPVPDARHAAAPCGRCGARPPEEGRVTCRPCLDTTGEESRLRRQRRSRLQLCVSCGSAPPAPGRVRCKPCGDRHARRSRDDKRARRAKLASQGLCTACGQRPPAEGRSTCQVCLDERNKHTRERGERLVALGLCKACGRNPAADGRVHCRPCLDAGKASQAASVARRVAAGTCARCRLEPVLPGSPHCASCGERLRISGRDYMRRRTEIRRARGLTRPGWGSERVRTAALKRRAGCKPLLLRGFRRFAVAAAGCDSRRPSAVCASHPMPRREQRVMISAWHPEAPFRLSGGPVRLRSPVPPSPRPPRPHGLRHAHSAWSYGHCCVRAGGR